MLTCCLFIIAGLPASSATQLKPTNKLITGGYQTIDTNDPEAKKAYKFLCDELKKEKPDMKNIKIIRAESQVVAGINYRLTCQYQKKSSKKNYSFEATIYRDLNGKMKITNLEFN